MIPESISNSPTSSSLFSSNAQHSSPSLEMLEGKEVIQISHSILLILFFKCFKQDLTQSVIVGKLMYKNGFPLRIPNDYQQLFIDSLNEEGFSTKLGEKQTQFVLRIHGSLTKLAWDQDQFLSGLKLKMEKIRFRVKDYLITLGMIKTYNKKSLCLKAQELRVKKQVVSSFKKQQKSTLNIDTKEKGEGVLLKTAINITKVDGSKEQKPKKGGYFIVKKDLFKIHQIKNGSENIFTQELASKEKRVEGKKTQLLNAKLEKELNIIKKIKNPKHFLTYWKSSLSQQFFMEYVPQTLKEELRSKNIQLHDKINILQQIVQSVHDLHEAGIVHRDIKAQNFLVKKQNGQNVLKLIDFGESVFIDQPIEKSVLPLGYTLPYSPFECIKSNEAGTKNKEIDYWSIGMMLYQLIHKKAPFTYGQFVGNNILEDWITTNSTQFEFFINHRKRKGLRLIEQLGTIMAANCLQLKQKDRLNLDQMMKILLSLEGYAGRLWEMNSKDRIEEQI